MIGVSPGSGLKPELEQPLAEVAGVVAEGGDALRMGLEILDARERARRDGRRQRVGEELRPGALRQVVADRRRAGHEAAGRAAERLAERRGDDVDLADQAEMLGRAAAARAQHAGGVRVVHHQHGVVPAAELDQVGQRGDRALHREDAVGDHHARSAGRVAAVSFASRSARSACW